MQVIRWILIDCCIQICFNHIKNQHAIKMMRLGLYAKNMKCF